MDYYHMQNILADTKMRERIGSDEEEQPQAEPRK